MAGARAQPIHFDTSGYLQANDLIARAGEIRAQGLLALGQGVSSGLGMMVQRREAEKDRSLRERMQAEGLSQEESQFARGLAVRQQDMALEHTRATRAHYSSTLERLGREKNDLLGMAQKIAEMGGDATSLAPAFEPIDKQMEEANAWLSGPTNKALPPAQTGGEVIGALMCAGGT
jgi:hypothetical protein